MALWIHNITPDDVPNDELHQYRVMINQQELTRFEHVRSDGAAACFRAAADAMDLVEKEGG